MLCYPQNDIMVEKNLSFDCSETVFWRRTKTPGSWSFEIENSRILEFWDRKLHDPEVFEKCFVKNDDFTSQQASYTKTKSTTETGMLCYTQNAIIVEKILFFDYSETTFRGETKTPGSWSLEIKNSRILEFWGWKLQDPGVLASKT